MSVDRRRRPRAGVWGADTRAGGGRHDCSKTLRRYSGLPHQCARLGDCNLSLVLHRLPAVGPTMRHTAERYSTWQMAGRKCALEFAGRSG